MEGTCENCTRRFFVPGAGTSEVACPSCGGRMVPERDQPSGVNSDGDLRNMSGPGYGQDMGGNPLTEGILAPSVAGERTQPMHKRDESYASVRTAATAQATPSMPAGIHMGCMGALQFIGATINGMPPGPQLYQWTIKEWLPAARSGQVQPVTVEVQNEHPSYLAAAVGVVNNSSACAGKRVPVEEFKNLIMGIQAGEIPPPAKQAKTASDFDLGDWSFDDAASGPQSTHKFIVDSQGSIYSLPEPAHHEQVAENAGLDMSNFPQGLSLGHINDDGSTEWYQHQSGLQPQQMAQGLEQHFGMPVTIDPSLKPSSSEERFGLEGPGARGKGRSEIQIAQDPPMPRSYGIPRDRNEGLVRGGHLDQSIHLPFEHLAMEKEAILPALAVPVGAAAVRVGGPLIAKKLAPKLLGGALKAGRGVASKGLKALGIHSIIKGLSGSGGGGQAAAPPRATAPGLSEVSHVTADAETVTSLPGLHENDGDTQQFKDGEATTNLEHPNDDEGGGSMSPAGALLDHLLPKVLEYYDSDEAGENDPLMKALDEALEREIPGYKDMDDDDHSDLEAFFADLAGKHQKEAAGQFFPGVGIQQGVQPGNAVVPPRAVGAPVGPQPAEAACPNCGALLNPDGSCAQCGFGAENQMQPGQVNQAVTPGTSVGGPSLPPNQAKVADTQGPYTPEQYKAVAEYLLQNGREAEIPHMYDAPWEYAGVLAQVQNKLNAPPPAVEAPAEPPMDPAMGMDPSMMGGAPPDPSQMQASIASAVARFGSDNIAPRCPKCDSHTTGMIATEDGISCRCHNCGNAWEEGDIAKTAEVAEHPHDQPVLEHSDLDDETDSPHPDDNDLTWKTPDGQPLTEGQEYEMHSDEYSIPDIVRVDQVKPGELVYTITGEYSELEDQTTITPEEVKQRGIKFLPVEGEMPTEESFVNTEPTPAARVPITTAVESGIPGDIGHAVNKMQYKMRGQPFDGGIAISKAMEYYIKKGYEYRDALSQARIDLGLDDTPLTPQLKRDDIRVQDQIERPMDPAPLTAKIEPPKEAAWLLEGTNVSAVPAPWETPLPDLTGGSLEEIVASAEPAADDRSWLVADLPKTAGAKFSPGEQRNFIDEEGEARNLDRLDLEDTHYRTRETSVYVAGRNEMRFAQPEMAPDDHLVFGL